MRHALPVLTIAALLGVVPPHAADAPRGDLVTVDVSVTDALGRAVPDLSKDDFVLTDGGRPLPLAACTVDTAPISGVVLLDRSGNMVWSAESVEEVGADFVTSFFGTGDRGRIGGFSGAIALTPPAFSSDPKELVRLVHASGQAAGPAPLWNAVAASIDALASEPGRRVLAVFSYSKDAPDPGDRHAALADVETAAQAAGVAIYAIGLGGKLRLGPAPALFQRGAQRGASTGRGATGPPNGPVGPNAVAQPDAGLKVLAADTGGDYVELTPGFGLDDVMATLAAGIHHRYALSFSPAALDGALHTIEVRTRRAGLTVSAPKRFTARPSS